MKKFVLFISMTLFGFSLNAFSQSQNPVKIWDEINRLSDESVFSKVIKDLKATAPSKLPSFLKEYWITDYISRNRYSQPFDLMYRRIAS